MLKQILAVLCCTSMFITSGCGFTLRGTQDLNTPVAYQTVQLSLDDNQEALHLKQALTKHLSMMGLQHGVSTNQIDVQNLKFHRYRLVGTLTEIRLVLSANITIRMGETATSMPMQVEQSYQYNEASVVTLDQQGEESKKWLYDQLGERIVARYRAMTLGQ